MPVVRPVAVVALSEVHERIVLRRVSEGRIAMFQGRYFDHGRRVPDYLPGVLESLIARELAVLAEEDSYLWRRVALTPAGQVHYAALCVQGQRRPDPPPGNPPPWVGASPAGHRVSPQGVRPGPALRENARVRWVHLDSRAHVLADNASAAALLTRCGQTTSPLAPVYSLIPSPDLCPRCAQSEVLRTPPPGIPTVF